MPLLELIDGLIFIIIGATIIGMAYIWDKKTIINPQQYSGDIILIGNIVSLFTIILIILLAKKYFKLYSDSKIEKYVIVSISLLGILLTVYNIFLNNIQISSPKSTQITNLNSEIYTDNKSHSPITNTFSEVSKSKPSHLMPENKEDYIDNFNIDSFYKTDYNLEDLRTKIGKDFFYMASVLPNDNNRNIGEYTNFNGDLYYIALFDDLKSDYIIKKVHPVSIKNFKQIFDNDYYDGTDGYRNYRKGKVID